MLMLQLTLKDVVYRVRDGLPDAPRPNQCICLYFASCTHESVPSYCHAKSIGRCGYQIQTFRLMQERVRSLQKKDRVEPVVAAKVDQQAAESDGELLCLLLNAIMRARLDLTISNVPNI